MDTILLCQSCGKEVTLTTHYNSAGFAFKEWVHVDGGGSVLRRCPNPECGYTSATYPPLKTCPKCVKGAIERFHTGKIKRFRTGTIEMVDDHIANPTLRREWKRKKKSSKA
jgi:hypothetical protein